jgi:hypothetical protein
MSGVSPQKGRAVAGCWQPHKQVRISDRLANIHTTNWFLTPQQDTRDTLQHTLLQANTTSSTAATGAAAFAIAVLHTIAAQQQTLL